jgi:hypothetical protein
VSLHRIRVHPVGCRISQVGFAPSATPTRRGGANAAHNIALENQWHKDMDAYKRLRNDGLQPPRIDGCHSVERDSTSTIQVEHGINSPLAKAEAAGYIDSSGTVSV